MNGYPIRSGRRRPLAATRYGHACERLEPRQVLAPVVAGDPAWFSALDAGPPAVPAMQEWIVQLTDEAVNCLGSPVAAAASLAAAIPGSRVIRGLGASGQLLIATPAATDTAALVALPQIALVEPNGFLQAAANEPDDPRYLDGSLWGLTNLGLAGGLAGADIDAATAWEMTQGESDVVVAVIDGGVDISHPDLAPNVWRNPGEVAGNGIDDDANGFIDDVYGWDFRDRNSSVFDAGDNSYGTQVAGIIAGRGDNGIGVTGVSWNSRIMPLKFIGSGGGFTADAIAAINYMTMMRQRGVNIRVANLSWGSTDSSRFLERAITDAGAAGILVVASAGNSGVDQDGASSPNYPSGFAAENILAVAATDNRDRLATDSNYGLTRVDLGAPGVGILSTVPWRGYAVNSGTSFATPFVSGVAALAVSVNPNLTVTELRQAIIAGVEPVPSLSSKTASGGRLNAAQTLSLVIRNDPSYTGREYLTVPAGETLVDSLSREGPRQLVIGATGRVVLEGTNLHTGGTRVESGTLVIRNPAALGMGTLEVLAGASVIIDIGFATAAVQDVDLSAGGMIDLGTGGLAVAAGGIDEATLRSWILAGHDGMTEAGVFSSAVTDETRTIGFFFTTAGVATLRFTAPGDLDLDQDVDILDLVAFAAAGSLGTGSPANWSQGDMDNDGLATVFDLVTITAGGGYGRGTIVPETGNRVSSLADGEGATGFQGQPVPIRGEAGLSQSLSPPGSLGAEVFAYLAAGIAWETAADRSDSDGSPGATRAVAGQTA